MRRTAILSVGLLMLHSGLSACKGESKEDGRTQSAQSADARDGSTGQDETVKSPEQTATLDGLGLAATCSYAAGADGQGCFTCTPRELPITHCVAVAADFDPASKCQHDLDRLICDIGKTEPFSIEFSDRSSEEDIYERFPILVFGTKALLLEKLEGKPDLRDLIFKVLDAIDRHKLALFTGGDLGPVVDEAKPLIFKAKPDLKDDQLAAIKTAVNDAAAAVVAKRRAGTVSYADLFTVITSSMKALPPELLGELLGDTKLEDYAQALGGAGGDAPLLSELTKLLGGEQALADAAAKLGVISLDAFEPAD